MRPGDVFDDTPPEGRLTHEQRARMRTSLLSATDDPVRRQRPWLVPVAAAAAVALLLCGGAIAALTLMGGTEATPAGTSGLDPSASAPAPEAIGTSVTLTIDDVMPTDGPCFDEVASYLPGAHLATLEDYDVAQILMFAQGSEWIACDTWAARDGGVPTLLGITTPDQPVTKDLFRISQNFSMKADGGAQYVAAGGPIPDVTAISYLFPTGDTVDATIHLDMWSMVYLLPEVPRRAWTEPVVVTVTLADGSTEQFDLVGVDLCAQVNHGC